MSCRGGRDTDAGTFHVSVCSSSRSPGDARVRFAPPPQLLGDGEEVSSDRHGDLPKMVGRTEMGRGPELAPVAQQVDGASLKVVPSSLATLRSDTPSTSTRMNMWAQTLAPLVRLLSRSRKVVARCRLPDARHPFQRRVGRLIQLLSNEGILEPGKQFRLLIEVPGMSPAARAVSESGTVSGRLR